MVRNQHIYIYSYVMLVVTGSSRMWSLHMGIEMPITHPCSIVQPRRNGNRSVFLSPVKKAHFQMLGPILTSVTLSGLYTVKGGGLVYAVILKWGSVSCLLF